MKREAVLTARTIESLNRDATYAALANVRDKLVQELRNDPHLYDLRDRFLIRYDCAVSRTVASLSARGE